MDCSISGEFHGADVLKVGQKGKGACVRAEKEGVLDFLFFFWLGTNICVETRHESLKCKIQSCSDPKHFQDEYIVAIINLIH